MPVYNYIHPTTGTKIEFARPVAERNEPLTLVFSRSPEPERVGRVVGIPTPGLNDEFRAGCYKLECEHPDAWKRGTPKKDYTRALNMPPPPKGPGAEGAFGEQ